MIKNPLVNSLSSMSPQKYFSGLIGLFVNVLFIFATVFFFFRLVLGGINWINSSGEKGKIEQSRSQVINAVIGLIVVLSTYVIVNFIAGIFKVDLLNFDLNAIRLQ